MDSIMAMATISLALQIVTLSIVLSGYVLKRKGQFLSHGTLMSVALIIQVASFLLIMGPSFLSLVENGHIQELTWVSFVTLLHASLGGITLVVGSWIVGGWHLQNSTENCVRKRIVMRYVFVVWTLSLILGIILYMLLYVHA
jgi:uncharacterized membrane protein YozB (DUF420 family)